ncbi:hypothetical protein EV1_035924 [Malus domestica]
MDYHEHTSNQLQRWQSAKPHKAAPCTKTQVFDEVGSFVPTPLLIGMERFHQSPSNLTRPIRYESIKYYLTDLRGLRASPPHKARIALSIEQISK